MVFASSFGFVTLFVIWFWVVIQIFFLQLMKKKVRLDCFSSASEKQIVGQFGFGTM